MPTPFAKPVTSLLFIAWWLIPISLFAPSLRSQDRDGAVAAQPANSEGPPIGRGLLRTRGGDVYRGQISPLSDGNFFAWSTPSLLQPLHFPWASLDALELRSTSPQDALPSQIFCAELLDGSAVSGELLSMTSDAVEMLIPTLGKREIPIGSLRHVLKLRPVGDASSQVLQATAWEQVLPTTKNGRATKWFLKAGEISTDTSGTTIAQWANLPELATIDLDVSWDQKSPNFWLTLGEPRRLELQVRKLQNKKLLNVTLLVENTKDADVITTQIPFEEGQPLSLRLMCDATKGIYALMQGEKVLGRLQGNVALKFVGRTKVQFTNTALGILTLRNLTISGSPFSIPSADAQGTSGGIEFMTKDRGTFFGSIRGMANPSSILISGLNNVESTVEINELERIEFPPRDVAIDRTEAVHLVQLQNGLRFAAKGLASQGGEEGSDDSLGAVLLPLLDSQIRIPIESIHRVSSLGPEVPTPQTAVPSEPSVDPRTFRLVTDDVVSMGHIGEVFEEGASRGKTFSWRARHAMKDVPMNATADGVIESIAAPEDRKRGGDPISKTAAKIRADGKVPDVEVASTLQPNDPNIYLKSGDCFPGTILAGNEEFVRFQTQLFAAQEIDSAQVRGLRFVNYKGADALDRATRNRLLTLPRMQRKNPPKHLVVSRDGDLVRGQLLSFDRDELKIEVRGEERTILMKNVAELIWLDAPPKPAQDASESQTTDDPKDATSNSPTASSESNTRTDLRPNPASPSPTLGVYQILLSEGARVSIVPEMVTAESLVGTHPQLGKCELAWSAVRTILLGNTIRLDASRGRFGKWKLQHAPDPKYMNEEDDANDRPADTAHMRIIGKEAPDFDLRKLDGTPCQLSDFEGKVLVLDFWATWCGPCIRSMPQLVQLSRQYYDAGVEVVFINLEESEERIRGFLEKMELNPTIAMDLDGSVSKQYAVQAIPQTVVIDRAGTVVKVLVGASEENERELRALLDELTGNVTSGK
ncbi:MAG: TlpA disulfide reductase family protein [Planctomycetota bacterium]